MPSTRRRSTTRRVKDAIALLKEDHANVKSLFDQFEKATSGERKRKLADKICAELKVHTTIEEEIFYPAVRESIEADDLLNEATVEHASAKDLIGQIEEGSPEDEQWDAKVTVLGEYIKHHVKEEHDELFPKVRKSGLDLNDLGERLNSRKRELSGNGEAPKSSGRRMGQEEAHAPRG